ncbi:MAG TPA: ribosome-associated translation inhibitor RaiA [Firmicutes bacterium]|nr:ribosome-associated translation inhibitor RaiA [Bacillota bacterium]
MNISIHGDHVKITEAIKEYIEEKISKLSKYFDEDTDVDVIVKVRVRGKEQIIEVTVPTKLFTIRAEDANDDLYTAIDLVQKKLETQIKKNKAKIAGRYRDKKGYVFSIDEVPIEEEESQIVRRKEVEFKPMDEEEAILQMELSEHDFFVFKNAKEKCTSVVYRRKDGKYGIINAR